MKPNHSHKKSVLRNSFKKIKNNMKKSLLIWLFFSTTCFFANAQFTKLYDFAGVANGSFPLGDLISDGTFLYGTTASGGVNNAGTVFKIMPNGTGYTDIHDFANAPAADAPVGSLFFDGTFLYGTTELGGANDSGTVFKVKPDGTGYAVILDFSGSVNGSSPTGNLISDGTYLYGMTWVGGINHHGTIFKIKPDGTLFSKLLDFAGATNGSDPYGSLISDGTYLYGMTQNGGTNNLGTIFKIMPNGTGYIKLLDFSGTANGSHPYGSLISDGTYLYGMTYGGGTSNNGVVFKIMPDGSGFTKLLNVAGGANGAHPNASLVSDGTFLYGMTYYGGTSGFGIIFKIKTDGTGFLKMADFSGAVTGASPNGSLFFDGTFLYGTTQNGGTSDLGVVFKCGTVTGIDENNSENVFSIYPNPSNGIFTLNPETNNGEISIYNSLCEIIFQSEIENRQLAINLSDEPNGIYFVTVRTKENSFTQKICIEK
jgi:uncharacterized repeat protein (TIGR03803 family)